MPPLATAFGRLRWTGLVVVLVALVVGPSGPLGAHGRDAVMELRGEPDARAEALEVTATLRYTGDAEPVEGATVVVTTVAPDGSAGPQLALDMVDPGVYVGLVGPATPGPWQVQAVVDDPSASAEVIVEVPPTGTPVAEEATTTTRSAGRVVEQRGEHEESDAVGRVLVVLVGIAIVVASVIAFEWRRRHRRVVGDAERQVPSG